MTCHRMTHHCSEPCSGGAHPCPLEEVKRTGKPVRVEHVHYDRENNKKYMEIYAYPIFDKDGKVVQLIEHTVDVSDRHYSKQEKE